MNGTNADFFSDHLILLTGAAGFIGANVAHLLLDTGAKVIGVDNLNTAYDPQLKHWRLRGLRKREGFTFHQVDISHLSSVEELFVSSKARLHGVVNLAARAGVRPSVEDPWSYLDTNVNGTLNLLELCRRYGVEKFVLASTSSLYGKHNRRPYKEDADTSRPLSPYAASKKAAETLCHTYHALHDLDVTVLRYFTVYGPAGRPDMSVFRFVRWIAEEEPLVLYGDGSQERDFTYVDDIARGTVAALRPLGYEVINLGGDRPASISSMVGMLEGKLGKKARLRRYEMHPADVPATWADIGKARELLNWEPRIPLEEGLQKTVAWYLEQRDWARKVILQ